MLTINLHPDPELLRAIATRTRRYRLIVMIGASVASWVILVWLVRLGMGVSSLAQEVSAREREVIALREALAIEDNRLKSALKSADERRISLSRGRVATELLLSLRAVTPPRLSLERCSFREKTLEFAGIAADAESVAQFTQGLTSRIPSLKLSVERIEMARRDDQDVQEFIVRGAMKAECGVERPCNVLE